MGNKEVLMVLLVATFFCSGGTASLGPFRLTTLPLVHLEDKNLEPKGQLKHLGNDGNGETSIPHHQRKVEGAFGSHAVNGGQPGNGGEGSNSPYAQGGAAIIAGGGSNIRHSKHHSAGSCIQSCGCTPVLLAAILLPYLLRNMYI